MLPLTGFFCDVLPTERGDPSYYAAFLSQYTLLTVPAIFSQAILTPGPFEGGDKGSLDSDVDMFVNDLPENAKARRKQYRALCHAVHLEPGEMPQDKEERTFVSELFINRSREVGMSNRELILSALNASAFLNYFFLLEDTLKNLHYKTCRPAKSAKDGATISGGGIISVYLKGILEAKGITSIFNEELARRSKFFANFDTLSATWSLMNIIRNRLVHHGGYYTPGMRGIFSRCLQDIVDTLPGDEHLVTLNLFLDRFEPIEDEVNKTGRLIFCDALENCIRNTSIYVIESLLLSERAARRSNNKKPHANRGAAKRTGDVTLAKKRPQQKSSRPSKL
ncbi:hypothetical protein [Thauera aromatica]|uniref:hypothetical protein n=1 Tax=Thauera aromatica TaxID=59405 RepID=UPI001FFD39B2|nr:hypothetical protein [Thauera aromatica]MCK2094596.1 hypothetical protein [Thauera aromatica]